MLFGVVRDLRSAVTRALGIIRSRRNAIHGLEERILSVGAEHPVVDRIEGYLNGIRGLEKKHVLHPGLVRGIAWVFHATFMVLIALAVLHTLLYILLTPIQSILPSSMIPMLNIVRRLPYWCWHSTLSRVDIAYKSVAYEFLRLMEEFIGLMTARARIAIRICGGTSSNRDGIHVGFILAQGLYEDFYSVRNGGLREVRSILLRTLPKVPFLGGLALSTLLFILIAGVTGLQ